MFGSVDKSGCSDCKSDSFQRVGSFEHFSKVIQLYSFTLFFRIRFINNWLYCNFSSVQTNLKICYRFWISSFNKCVKIKLVSNHKTGQRCLTLPFTKFDFNESVHLMVSTPKNKSVYPVSGILIKIHLNNRPAVKLNN